MPTKKEDKKKLRHNEWAEQIAECQSSRIKIKKRLHCIIYRVICKESAVNALLYGTDFFVQNIFDPN